MTDRLIRITTALAVVAVAVVAAIIGCPWADGRGRAVRGWLGRRFGRVRRSRAGRIRCGGAAGGW